MEQVELVGQGLVGVGDGAPGGVAEDEVSVFAGQAWCRVRGAQVWWERHSGTWRSRSVGPLRDHHHRWWMSQSANRMPQPGMTQVGTDRPR